MLFQRHHLCLALTSGWLVMLTTAFSPAEGQDARLPTSDSVEAKPTRRPFDLSYKYMTGNWGGVRSELEDEGIKFKITLMNQLMVNMHGGKETKNGHDTAGSYEFNMYFDMDKLLDIPDATFWIRAKGTWGGVRHNVVNGTLSFVKGYTSDLWEALIPAVDDFIGE